MSRRYPHCYHSRLFHNATDEMLSFVRLHSPLTRQIASRPTRSLCTARLQYLPTPSVFEGKAKYVVLSDLHVKRETVDTCIQALQIAHDEALKRDAAILFLGDFWHARGNLPVQPLNAVLTHLATWRVPVVMIPGNHDLISRGGHGVSLVPLATTLGEDRCLLITKPTLCLEALFLPYMHDTATLKSVLKEASVHPHEPHAIFCHVEVSGARLADRIVSASSSRSIDPSDFPPKTNVYSGHIHRPHVVTDVIHYVGSPYQVSASEHGQQKSLLVLDKSQGWRIIEHIPIDIGPRHFTINYLSPFILPKFRRADRLTLLASGNTARNFVEALRDDGIRVELQPLRNHNINSKDSNTDDLFAPVEPRISQGTLSNSGLFSEYAAIKNLGKDVTRAGAEVLRELGGHMSSNMSGKEVVVQWKEVFLRGFGTFLGSATYPLENRGLVLLTGRDCDADGVITGRTNATGKTTLAMAALWAMTGRTDARPDGSVEKGVSLEMVHDDARECEVSVKLDLSGERALSEAREMIPNEDKNRFQAHVTDQGHSQQTLNVVVKRTSTRNGKSYRQGLTLELNGVDVSCLDVKETQSRIDRLVDGTLLPHTVFFGQHMGAGRGLLDSTDRTLKEHLALVFPLDVWKEARKRSRMKLLKRQENQVSLEASLEAGKALVSRIQIGEASSNKQLDQFESQRKQRLLDIDNRINEMITSRRRVDEDSIWFSESFAVSNSSDEVNAVLEDTRRALRSLDEPKKDGLEQARSAAEVEMARLMAALAADEELDARLSSLVTRALDYEKKTETKRANIEAFMLSLKQEVDRCPSPAEIDMRWKECLEKSRKCDEKMQALVGINIRNGEGHNFNGISDLLSSVDAARSKAFKLQDEKVRLRTSLHEIRHRLLQSEEFSLFKSENYETETPIIAVPHSSLVTCEKCLRPFDGVLYEEARSKLEVEARSVEQAISSAEDLWEQEKECLDAAVRNVEDRIEREKSAIVEEKKAMNARMGKLRLVQQTRTSLNREMNEYLTQLEQLRAEPNLYMEELRALNIVTLPSSSSVSECTDIVNEFMFKKLERSLITITEAESAYSHIMEQVQKRRREELDLISKQKSLQELLEDLQGLQADCRILEGERNSIATEKNPYEEAVRRQQKDINRESALVQKREKENAELSDGINVMKALDVAFGPRGVPSFVLEEGLTWLEKATDKYLHLLSAGELLLQIRAFSDYKSSYRADGENKEVISKKIFVRNPNSSALRERSLRQLSGGQRRRCSLAFALAFADLAHERAGFQSSLLVLDEILQSLDQDGRQRMSRVLPKLFEESHGQRNTVVVVAQDEAPEIAGFAHGGVDVVERRSNQSTVFLDGKTSAE